MFQNDKLQAVRLIQYDNFNDCGRELYRALRRIYGLPAGQGSVGYLAIEGFGNSYDYYGYAGGRAIRLRLLQSGQFAELSYAPDIAEIGRLWRKGRPETGAPPFCLRERVVQTTPKVSRVA